MKTAMQELMDDLIADSKFLNGPNDHPNDKMVGHYLMTIANGIKEKFLNIEKKQIIDAYYAGTAQFDNAAAIVKPEGPEKYFLETFAPLPTPA